VVTNSDRRGLSEFFSFLQHKDYMTAHMGSNEHDLHKLYDFFLFVVK